MIEPTMIEISGMVSVEEGAIVFEINPVAIVTTPGRIIIVSIAGEVCFTYGRSGVVTPIINRNGCGGVDSGAGNDGTYINPRDRYADTNMRTDEYLRITFTGDEAGGYNGGKDE